MNFTSSLITFQEIPHEISLSYLISGCPLRCPSCHSSSSWNPKMGTPLKEERFCKDIEKNRQLITCVLFLGGEWHPIELIFFLKIAQKKFSLKTALYTGRENISTSLEEHLDYLKTGPYRSGLGGLQSPHTNQKLIDVKTRENLNHLFQIQGGSYGLTQ